MDAADLLSQFQTVGSDLYSRGMVSVHGGNLSVRREDRVIITRSGSRLGYLELDDLIQTGLFLDDENTRLASSELAVHRAIYRQNLSTAIVHSHPVHAVALSFVQQQILPQDEGGKLFIPTVPVIGYGREPVPGGFAEEVAEALLTSAAVVVHKHGCFVRGMSLAEAYVITELLEISSRILCLTRSLKS